MSGHIRIRTTTDDLPRILRLWSTRFGGSAAVHLSEPNTVMLALDTPVEAIERLVSRLGEHTEVEVVWRSTRTPWVLLPLEA